MDIYICISIDQLCFWQTWAGEAGLNNVGIKVTYPTWKAEWASKGLLALSYMYPPTTMCSIC